MYEHDYVVSDELYHYGRKGMKWGQHIFGKVKTGAKKAKSAADAYNARKTAKKSADVKKKRAKITNPKKLTTEELNERIKRLELEQSYKKLVKSTEPDYVASGKKILQNILEKSVENIGGQTVSYMMGVGVNKAAIKLFEGITEDIINPKKGQKDK